MGLDCTCAENNSKAELLMCFKKPDTDAEENDDVQDFESFEAVQAMRLQEVQNVVEEKVDMGGQGRRHQVVSIPWPRKPAVVDIHCTSTN